MNVSPVHISIMLGLLDDALCTRQANVQRDSAVRVMSDVLYCTRATGVPFAWRDSREITMFGSKSIEHNVTRRIMALAPIIRPSSARATGNQTSLWPVGAPTYDASLLLPK